MHKLLSISFAFILLTEAFMPNMDMCELKKLDDLFEHYWETDTTLINFIAIHYGNYKNQKHDQDAHDGQLPFQGNTCCQMPLFVSEFLTFSCEVTIPRTAKMYSFYKVPCSSAFLSPVFQPPKQA